MNLPLVPPAASQPSVRPPVPANDRGDSNFSDILDKTRTAERTEPTRPKSEPTEAAEAAPGEKPEAVEPEAEDSDAVSDALATVLDGLAELRAALQGGTVPDPGLLDRLNQSVERLAGTLGLSLDQMPTLDKLAAIATRPAVEGEPIQAQLQGALAPTAQALLGETEQPQLMALGGRLGALVLALGDTAPDQGATLAADIEKAAASLPKTAANPLPPPAETPALADAEVKIAEPGLSVTKTEAAATEPPRAAQAKSVQPIETKDAPRGARLDAQPSLAAVNADAAAEAQAAASNAPSTPQAKTEAVALAPRPIQPGYQTSQQQLNLPQLAFEVARQVHDGHTRFQIRLDPAELGRIDVKLDIDAGGQVHARLTVEKAETLDLMQRDQRGLEKALQQAGLDGAKTNLEFSLKQNGFGQDRAGEDGHGRPGLFGDRHGTAEADESAPTVNLYRGNLSASGVNIFV